MFIIYALFDVPLVSRFISNTFVWLLVVRGCQNLRLWGMSYKLGASFWRLVDVFLATRFSSAPDPAGCSLSMGGLVIDVIFHVQLHHVYFKIWEDIFYLNVKRDVVLKLNSTFSLTHVTVHYISSQGIVYRDVLYRTKQRIFC